METKRKWSDLSTGAKALVIVGSIIELALTTMALRDLRGRETDSVRGPKWLWRLAAFVQPVGPITYLLIGRRKSA